MEKKSNYFRKMILLVIGFSLLFSLLGCSEENEDLEDAYVDLNIIDEEGDSIDRDLIEVRVNEEYKAVEDVDYKVGDKIYLKVLSDIRPYEFTGWQHNDETYEESELDFKIQAPIVEITAEFSIAENDDNDDDNDDSNNKTYDIELTSSNDDFESYLSIDEEDDKINLNADDEEKRFEQLSYWEFKDDKSEDIYAIIPENPYSFNPDDKFDETNEIYKTITAEFTDKLFIEAKPYGTNNTEITLEADSIYRLNTDELESKDERIEDLGDEVTLYDNGDVLRNVRLNRDKKVNLSADYTGNSDYDVAYWEVNGEKVYEEDGAIEVRVNKNLEVEPVLSPKVADDAIIEPIRESLGKEEGSITEKDLAEVKQINLSTSEEINSCKEYLDYLENLELLTLKGEEINTDKLDEISDLDDLGRFDSYRILVTDDEDFEKYIKLEEIDDDEIRLTADDEEVRFKQLSYWEFKSATSGDIDSIVRENPYSYNPKDKLADNIYKTITAEFTDRLFIEAEPRGTNNAEITLEADSIYRLDTDELENEDERIEEFEDDVTLYDDDGTLRNVKLKHGDTITLSAKYTGDADYDVAYWLVNGEKEYENDGEIELRIEENLQIEPVFSPVVVEEEPDDGDIPDDDMITAIRQSINKREGALTEKDLSKVESINLSDESDIGSLKDISEYLVNLDDFTLRGVGISTDELKAISELSNLKRLNLSRLVVTDNDDNRIENSGKDIETIEAFSQFSKLNDLEVLILNQAGIKHLNFINELKNIGELWLIDNDVWDISPLKYLDKTGNLDSVYLQGNDFIRTGSDVLPEATDKNQKIDTEKIDYLNSIMKVNQVIIEDFGSNWSIDQWPEITIEGDTEDIIKGFSDNVNEYNLLEDDGQDYVFPRENIEITFDKDHEDVNEDLVEGVANDLGEEVNVDDDNDYKVIIEDINQDVIINIDIE